MHVYGELSGTLTSPGTISGSLSGSKTISGELTIPSAVLPPSYEGEYEVIPKAYESQTLETKDKLMEDNVFIFSVPYFQTSNEHGDTVYIASEV